MCDPMEFFKTLFEDKEAKDIVNDIVDSIVNYDVFDVISRVAGLNLLSENQNKAVLTDTLIQYIISRPREYFKSNIKMSDKKFKSLMEDLNNTFLAASVDPCENVFVQNVMLNGENHRVFNGIDITPAYNLQALIRALFGYRNNFDFEYLEKVNRLFAFLLGISEEVARSQNIRFDKVRYSEERRVIIPDSGVVRQNADCVRIPLERAKRFADDFFDISEICVGFGECEKGEIDNRPFYSKPFLIDEVNDTIIILNISLIPAYALYKAFDWADRYGIKKDVIKRYNEYLWLEVSKTLDIMGHKKVNEKAYDIECICNDYYKEMVTTVYNNQLMLVFFICDDGVDYSDKTMHSNYPNECHTELFNSRIKYYKDNLHKLNAGDDDIFCLFVIGSIGRALGVAIEKKPFAFKPILLNTFELHCIKVNEGENMPFLPRYIRAKNQLRTMDLNAFSELNAICIYTSNHNSFYMSDDFDPDETETFIAPGDSIEYITRALLREDRQLIDSYDDGNKMEVILLDKKRNIYAEDQLFSGKYVAFCVICENIKIWIKTDEITNPDQVNVFFSLVDALSYWLAECKTIIERYLFPYDVYTIHISLKGVIREFYYERLSSTAFVECIDQDEEKNHIYLSFKPQAFGNLNQTYNYQEKELMRYILDIIDHIAFENRDYSKELDWLFRNPLKKRFYSVDYDKRPYLKPLNIQNHRTVHTEDEDYLAGLIGKELLKTGKWNIGVVEDCQRNEVAKTVVRMLFSRLESKVAEYEPVHMLEIMYHDIEETLYHLMLAERRFYSDIACYPEKEEKYLEAYNTLNRTSMALKFLLEYVTARPSCGTKHFGMGQYEELLAICSMIIDWAYKGDLFFYNIVNTHIEFLISKRVGMKHDEFSDMYQYSDIYRRRQLRYDSSYPLRKEYIIESEDFGEELEFAFEDEFGYSYSTFLQVVAAMATIDEHDVVCISEFEVAERIKKINESLSEEAIDMVLKDITYCQRKEYLKIPKGFDKEDAFPWRFNRRYSFNRRPVLKRDNELIWGPRQVYHMAEYVTDLIYSGKFKANSDSMKSLCGKIAKAKGAAFNNLIFQMLQDMNTFILDSNVKKINGKRIAEGGGDLGDIDILIVDETKSKIIVTEVKNFRFSRNPREINLEYEKMFVDKEDKPCFATKHNKRKAWVENHIDDVKKQYGLSERVWTVTSLFIVNQPLISQHIYKRNIKCISKAELCVEAIREV